MKARARGASDLFSWAQDLSLRFTLILRFWPIFKILSHSLESRWFVTGSRETEMTKAWRWYKQKKLIRNLLFPTTNMAAMTSHENAKQSNTCKWFGLCKGPGYWGWCGFRVQNNGRSTTGSPWSSSCRSQDVWGGVEFGLILILDWAHSTERN